MYFGRRLMIMLLKIPLKASELDKLWLQQLFQRPVSQKIIERTISGNCPSDLHWLQVKFLYLWIFWFFSLLGSSMLVLSVYLLIHPNWLSLFKVVELDRQLVLGHFPHLGTLFSSYDLDSPRGGARGRGGTANPVQLQTKKKTFFLNF